MRIFRVYPKHPDLHAIELAANVIRMGGFVVYPTDTCYALGVNALNPRAVLELYRLKKRSLSKYITMALSDVKELDKYAVWEIKYDGIIQRFLPGPVTFIMHKKAVVPDILNPTAVGIRIPDNDIARLLVNKAGVPVTATSANISGAPQAYKIENIVRYFGEGVDVILDAGQLPYRPPSTIVDLTGPKPVLIREGAVPFAEILRVLRETA